MRGDWVTLPEAAQRLGISTSTARRWIREGKLQAIKEPGPYGPEYRIEVDQITTAQEIKDVVRVDHPVDLSHVASVLDRHLGERDTKLAQRLDTLRTELILVTTSHTEGIETLTTLVREGMQKQEAQLASLQSELQRTREELAAAATPQPPVPWWRRLWPW